MKFVFLNRDTGTGGLQTAMLRMAKWLQAHGHECVVLTVFAGNLTAPLQQVAKVYQVTYPTYYGLTLDRATLAAIQGAHCIHTFSWDSIVLALKLTRLAGCALMVGVYHPRAFNFFPVPPRPYYAEYYRQLFSEIDDENILFMNESTRGTNRVDFNRAFDKSLLLPVPVELPAMQKDPGSAPGGALRLLSVGRLVNFKQYPLGVCKLIATGRWPVHRLRFSIYGDGPHRADIEHFIATHGLQQQVSTHGEVQYSELARVFRNHDMFIGMGTSALEASASGLPTIVAPAYGDGGLVSGFFHEQTGYNYGEAAGDRPTEMLLDELVNMKLADLRAIGLRDRQAAERFLADALMPAYLSHVEKLLVRPKHYPTIRFSAVAHAVISGFLTSRVPILNSHWRRQNWHHPAQDK